MKALIDTEQKSREIADAVIACLHENRRILKPSALDLYEIQKAVEQELRAA